MNAVYEADDRVQILIIYYTRFGVVKRLAECIAGGAQGPTAPLGGQPSKDPPLRSR